ncbi:MAG: S-layer homology domain-containing protein [Oscillospiraceae bacterium]|nr:S-layer homology domain-containing protein [Oscillospiraceae bacterium]
MKYFKRTLSILMTAVLTLSLLPLTGLAAMENAQMPSIQTAQGSFLIEIWDGGAYQTAAVIEADKFQRDFYVDLNGAINPKLRISKQAGGMALLDAVLLDGMPPVLADCDEAYLLRKLSVVDLDVLEIDTDGIVLGFASAGQTLVLTGRIEPDPPGGLPFLFDVKTDVDRNVTTLLASYSMDNYGTLDIDGVAVLDPADSFRVYPTRPTSGHPDSQAWVWVMHDDEYLYAAAEWGSDNTYDYGLDFFKVFIEAGGEIKEYTQWSDRGDYGMWAFAYTDLLPYQHMCYQIAIPLAELGNPENVKLGFSLYGTAYTDRWIDWSGSFPSTSNYADAYTPGAWNDDVKELTIYTAAELGRFAAEVNSKENSYPDSVGYDYEGWTIYLGDDIDLSDYKWYPINLTNVVFDGQGHTISGMVVEDSVWYATQWGENADAAGLFGGLDRAIVKNLTLKNPTISLNSFDWFPSIGAVAGYAEGAQIRDVVIINPQIECRYIFQAFLGGVLGYAIESEDPNSTVNIINGVEVYGGRVFNNGTSVSNCSDSCIGGVIGANNNGAVINAAVYGTKLKTAAPGSNTYIGGIAGYTSAESPIELASCLLNNISMAVFEIADDSESNFYVGGICGFVNRDHVVNNLYIGDIDLFGELVTGTYTVCNNEKYEDVAAANAAAFTDIFNDATPDTGGFWLAASITDDDTGYGFEESMKKLKIWTVDTILSVPNTPAFGAYWTPPESPTVNWPTGLTATYGQTLGDITLPTNGAGTAGSFTWTAGDSTDVGGVGDRLHNLTFTPTDGATYATVYQDITVTVKTNQTSAPQYKAPPTSESTQQPADGSVVLVDGKETSAGEVTYEDGMTTVDVNQGVLNAEIENASESVTVMVPSNGADAASAAQAVFVVKNVDDMADRDMALSIITGNIQYDMPATAVDTAAIMAALGAEDPSEVPLFITISSDVGADADSFVRMAADGAGMELVMPPMTFTVTATYNGQTYEVTGFTQFVSRTVEITSEQAAQITTAVVVDPDGSVRHVPTNVFEKDGKWYATVNSLTNSVYALIFNDKSFEDAEDKWYEAIANEMGSRGIVNGISNGAFDGERSITRAEFTALVVRALGLPDNGDSSVFDDVRASSWYAGIVGKALEIGLVGGAGGRFEPERAITREEAMVVLWRAAKVAGYDGIVAGGEVRSVEALSGEARSDSVWTDEGAGGSVAGVMPGYDALSDWAIEATMWCVANGLVPDEEWLSAPQGDISRAYAAALVLQFLQDSGLVDERTSAFANRIGAEPGGDPRRKPDAVQVPGGTDEEAPTPAGDGGAGAGGNGDGVGGSDGGNAGGSNDGGVIDAQGLGTGDAVAISSQMSSDAGLGIAPMTPQEAIAELNAILAMCR